MSGYYVIDNDTKVKNTEKLDILSQKIADMPSGTSFRSTELCKELKLNPRSFCKLLPNIPGLEHRDKNGKYPYWVKI